MSQIIIIDSVEALIAHIESEYSKGEKTFREVIASLHPIEVPSDAGEVVDKVRLGGYALNANDPGDRGPNGDDYHFTLTTDEAAALITAYSRTVPTSFIRSIAKTYYDYNVPKNCGDADYEEWNDEECKIIAQQYGYHAE